MTLISKAGIVDGQVIYAEHVIRIINALSGIDQKDILVYGGFQTTGSFTVYGSASFYGDSVRISSSLFITTSSLTNNDSASRYLVQDPETGRIHYISSSVVGNYSGPSPSNITVGGLPAGTSLTGRNALNILEEMLVDYLTPTFSSFLITGQSTQLETGTTISGTKTFTWVTTNQSNVATGSIIITNNTSGSTLASGLNDDSSEVLGIGTITNSTETTQVFRIQGTNTNSNTFTRDFTITYKYYYWYGASSVAPTTSAQVRALPGYRFNGSGSTWDLQTGNVEKIFTVAVPSAYTITSVLDLDALNANITANYILSTFNVQDANSNNVSYNVYTCTNAIPYSSNHRHQITIA